MIIVFLQLVFFATVLIDIPIARQVVGFLLISFVPGFIIVRLLKIDELPALETILLSVGSSIAFLMIVGLLANQLGLLAGISRPLSLMPLMIVLNVLVLILAVSVYLKGTNFRFPSLGIGLFPRVLLLSVFPILTVLGAMWVNAYGNNLILIVLFMTVSLLFVFGLLSKKCLPPTLYPLAVLMIAIVLLFSSSLISKYIVNLGSDLNEEYFVFKTTQNGALWVSNNSFLGSATLQRLNAMLSLTVLPTLYSNLLNIDATWTFKIIFPLILCLVPLTLYEVWKTHFDAKYAFIAAFFFMAESTFYGEVLGLARQMVGEFFFALLLLVIFNKKMSNFNKMTCFMLFSFALIVSHYALAEIFVFFIFLTFVILKVMKRPSTNVKVSMVLLFLVMMFAWYIYTSGSSTFNALTYYANYVYNQQTQFFNPSSRGTTVMQGLGLESAPSVWNTFSRYFAYALEGLIVIGFIALITKQRKSELDRGYFVVNIIAGLFLGAVVILPGLANTLNMSRFYHILLFFLAPLAIIGGETIVWLFSRILKRRPVGVSILMLIVLVPFFFFQTGFVYEVTRSNSWSLPLSMYRMSPFQLYYSLGYVSSVDVSSAEWISKNGDFLSAQLYADLPSQGSILMPYAMINPVFINILSNTTDVPRLGIVYLSSLNVEKTTVVGTNNVWNISEITPVVKNMNLIYSNGPSEIYENGAP
jgi:uncharacterized membrane protein